MQVNMISDRTRATPPNPSTLAIYPVSFGEAEGVHGIAPPGAWAICTHVERSQQTIVVTCENRDDFALVRTQWRLML